ncbi:FecR family protein [Mucilaginibacter sp. Mucisp86]|uniref:FecR family protein n=1 Tax=Mucilaginibacter sp. Mucisp86 TaxID=3243060 RepID=UPI0039B660A4
MENRDDIRKQFIRYLAGESSPEEAEQLLRYIHSGQDREFIELLIGEHLDHPVAQQLANDTDTQNRLQQTHERLRELIRPIEEPKVVRLQWIRIVAVAASITLLLTGGWLFRDNIRNWIDPVKMAQLTTLKGEHKQITLSDGTQIWLSPASSLEYPHTFNRDTREIRLSGSAFFEVAKDSKHPFSVHTGKITTQVLGTSFQVDAYNDQPEIAVTLLTGKVLLASGSDTTHLQPKQRGKVNKNTGKIQKTDYPEADEYLARRDGVFDYQGEPAVVVITDIQREFNISIDIVGAVRHRGFYGSISLKDGALVAVQKLCATIGATYERQDDHFTIHMTGR